MISNLLIYWTYWGTYYKPKIPAREITEMTVWKKKKKKNPRNELFVHEAKIKSMEMTTLV